MEEQDVFVCDFIHIKRTGINGTAYPLSKQSELVLGKSESCDFRVQVPSACDRHAKLRVDNSGKVFVSSLVPTVPVNLDGVGISKETLVPNKGVISVGSCKFKFVYREGFATSPLLVSNKPTASPGRKPKKSIGTPAAKDKENAPSPGGRSLSRTPRGTPGSQTTTPASSQPPNKSPRQTGSSAQPLTPVPSSKKKGRVSTPTVGRTRRSSARSSSLSSSLVSIPEETTPQASADTTPASSSVKAKKTDTPTLPHGRLSRSRMSSSMSVSLMSIQEEDESLATSPLAVAAASSTAGPWWLVAEPTSKRLSCKSVSFGPALSPEVFNKRLPPSTPMKAGTVPGGTRRSHPANLAKSDTLELVTEEEEMREEEDMVEYSMTGFEDTSSSDEDTEEEEEGTGSEEESDETPIASPARQATLQPTPPRGEKPRRYRKLATPLRRAIQEKPPLRSSRRSLCKTRRSLPTPIRTAIHSRVALRRTRKALNTPLRKHNQNRPALRKTKRSLPTPLCRAIRGRVELRKTKRSMPTPLREAIQGRPPLHQTRQKVLTTPMRREIEARPTLRKTKKSLPTPMRSEIEALRKTRRALATPIRKEIEGNPELRKTTRSMPTPIRREIESQPALHKIRRTLPTPVREEISARPPLRKTKRSLPTPLRLALQMDHRHALHKTKPALPTPLRTAIQQRPSLRPTKRSLPPDLLSQIESKPKLRVTKPTLPTPLREDIKRGVGLRPVRSKRAYTDTMVACETPVPAPPAKRRKVANTPLPHHSSTTSTPRPPAKPAKRGYSTTVLPSETPVPAPPAKRMRVADSPILSTPRAYDFGAFVHVNKSSPMVNFSGLPHLFKSPRTVNLADPADVFEVRLFGGSHEVSFASPLTSSSKGPPSRPTSAQGLQSCLKPTNQPSLFTIGTTVESKRSHPKRGRKSSRTVAATVPIATRITRSRASKPDLVPQTAMPPTGRRGRSAAKDTAGDASVVTLRATRSRSATVDNSDLKSSQPPPPPPPVPTRRGTRSARTLSTPQEEEEEEAAGGESVPRAKRGRVTAEPNEEGTSSRARRQKSRSTAASNKSEEAPVVTTRSTRQHVKEQKSESLPAVVERPPRQSRRLATVVPDQARSTANGNQLRGRTRQTVEKTAAVAGADKENTTAMSNTRSSHSKKEASAVPVRRSSRLRK